MRQLKISKQITLRTSESVGRYFLEINKYPVLTAEEEAELCVKIRERDSDALNKLIVSNLRFVISVAKQYQNKGLSFNDLINEGNYGLVKAALKFDDTRGFKFISYAVWWIRQSIYQAISEQTRIVRLPINRLSSINKIKRAIPFLEQEFERNPTENEIAGFLNINSEDVKTANDIKSKPISFDSPVRQGDGNDLSLYDIFKDVNIASPDEYAMKESLDTNINRALNKLSKRESEIITMLFGLFGTPIYSLSDVALKFGMTSERIRQIKSSALSKLRRILNGKHPIYGY